MVAQKLTNEELETKIKDLEKKLRFYEDRGNLNENTVSTNHLPDLLKAVLNHTNDYVLICDKQGTPKAFNNAYARLMKEALGIDMAPGIRTHEMLSDPEAVKYWDQLYNRALGGDRFRAEYTYEFEKDDVRTFEVSFIPILKNDKVNGFIELTRDISDSRRTEEKLKKNERRYQNLIEGSIQGILIHRNQRPLFVNLVWASIHGYSPEEILRMTSIVSLISPNDRARMIGYEDAHLKGGNAPSHYEYQGVRKDGSLVWLESRVMAVHWDGEPAIQSIIVDITERKYAEKALQKSESRYRVLIEDMPALICSFLPGGEITFVNKAYCDYFGQSSNELAGSTFLSLIPEADQKTVMTNISALTLNSPTQSHEHSVIGQSGDIRWQRWTNRALFDEQGKVVGYQSIGEDITERKYAEEALKESEELHRITLSNISDAVFMTDDAGNFTYICPNVNAIFGYTYEEVFAFENIEKLLGANLFDGSELEASKELRNIEAEVRDKSGSMHSLLVSVKRVSIKGGTLLYTCRDITERKQAEEALKERENFLGTLVDAIPIPVFYKDRDGRYIGVNAAFEAFFGETREKLIDKTVFDINPPELAAIYHAKDKELFESKGIQRYEAQVRNAKGVLRDVIFNKSVFTDRTGITTGIIGAILDITERKLAEKSLQDSEARLKALSDASFEAIFFSDKGVCLDQNQTAERMFGYTHDEAIGRLATEWIIPEDQELVMEMVRSRREEPYEVTALCKNGKAFPCEIQGRMFDYGGRSIRVTSLRDITQRKQAEQALKKSEERFRRIFEDIILGIFQFTADGRIINVNPAFSKMFGYASPEHIVEAIGDSASQLYVHPGDHKRLIRQISNSEVPLEAEVNFNRNDGSNFVGNFHGWKVMDTKYDTFFLEGFIEDITERKSAEDSLRESHKRLQFLSARLLNSQENEQRRISLEIHDDMGQDLALLKMHLITIAGRLWKDQLKLKDDISRTLVLIDGIIEKARNLSRDLNPDIIEDLKLSGALDWLINEIEKHVAIRISLELESVDHLFSTEHQIVIYRIIQEALKNIVKHAKAETAAVKIEKHKNCVMLKIEDDGKGFDISSVWEKHVADRGLGLAAMDERSRILGGVLDMRSKSGHGTCITLRIPIRRETDGK